MSCSLDFPAQFGGDCALDHAGHSPHGPQQHGQDAAGGPDRGWELCHGCDWSYCSISVHVHGHHGGQHAHGRAGPAHGQAVECGQAHPKDGSEGFVVILRICKTE